MQDLATPQLPAHPDINELAEAVAQRVARISVKHKKEEENSQ